MTVLQRSLITPAEAQKRIAGLSARHRRWIEEAAGNPPDLSKIPDSLWKKIEDENTAALLIILIGVAQPALAVAAGKLRRGGYQLPLDDAATALDRAAAQRAQFAGSTITQTARERIQNFIRGNEDYTTSQVDSLLEGLFGEGRSNTIAATETAAAQTIGSGSAAEIAQSNEVACTEVWYLGACKHCDLCPEFHRTPRSFWGRFVGPPPIHPNCCCSTQIVIGDEMDLRSRGMLFPGNAASVIAKLAKFRRP